MKKRQFGLFALLSVSTLLACELRPEPPKPRTPHPLAGKVPAGALRVLDKAGKFELLSLDPNETHGYNPDDPSRDNFHTWKVLGRTKITRADTQDELRRAFVKGVEENKYGPNSCYHPRHGIRLADGDTIVIDLVICFECHTVKWYRGDFEQEAFFTDESAEPMFDRVLKATGVPLAPKH